MKKIAVLIIALISVVFFIPNIGEAVCLARDSFIMQPHVAVVRNNTQLTIDIPYFYNGCEGNNVVIFVGLLNYNQYVSYSEKANIGKTLGDNEVRVQMNVPSEPYDNESHKMVAFMMEEEGRQGRIINDMRFEYIPKRRGYRSSMIGRWVLNVEAERNRLLLEFESLGNHADNYRVVCLGRAGGAVLDPVAEGDARMDNRQLSFFLDGTKDTGRLKASLYGEDRNFFRGRCFFDSKNSEDIEKQCSLKRY